MKLETLVGAGLAMTLCMSAARGDGGLAVHFADGATIATTPTGEVAWRLEELALPTPSSAQYRLQAPQRGLSRTAAPPPGARGRARTSPRRTLRDSITMS